MSLAYITITECECRQNGEMQFKILEFLSAKRIYSGFL